MRRLLVCGFVGAVLLPFAACGSSYDCEGTSVEKKLTVDTPADPSLQLKVDSCRVDVDACPALCQLAMKRVSIDYNPDSCDVGFAGDTVHMTVRYTAYPNDCFFGDDVAPTAGGGF